MVLKTHINRRFKAMKLIEIQQGFRNDFIVKQLNWKYSEGVFTNGFGNRLKNLPKSKETSFQNDKSLKLS